MAEDREAPPTVQATGAGPWDRPNAPPAARAQRNSGDRGTMLAFLAAALAVMTATAYFASPYVALRHLPSLAASGDAGRLAGAGYADLNHFWIRVDSSPTGRPLTLVLERRGLWDWTLAHTGAVSEPGAGPTR